MASSQITAAGYTAKAMGANVRIAEAMGADTLTPGQAATLRGALNVSAQACAGKVDRLGLSALVQHSNVLPHDQREIALVFGLDIPKRRN